VAYFIISIEKVVQSTSIQFTQVVKSEGLLIVTDPMNLSACIKGLMSYPNLKVITFSPDAPGYFLKRYMGISKF
jgi:hypothetical protein